MEKLVLYMKRSDEPFALFFCGNWDAYTMNAYYTLRKVLKSWQNNGGMEDAERLRKVSEETGFPYVEGEDVISEIWDFTGDCSIDIDKQIVENNNIDNCYEDFETWAENNPDLAETLNEEDVPRLPFDTLSCSFEALEERIRYFEEDVPAGWYMLSDGTMGEN